MKHIVFDHDGTLVEVGRDGFVLFEGMKHVVEGLHRAGHKVYVWTARDRYGTLSSLKANAILPFIEDLRCANDGPPPKPAPDGLEDMLEGINKADVVVIGDNYSDMIGAKKFGAKCIGALWNDPAKKPVLDEFGADRMVTRIDDLMDCILDIFK
jgi:phosphoglycolate phosphatase-like HAD superfamily hydrolase